MSYASSDATRTKKSQALAKQFLITSWPQDDVRETAPDATIDAALEFLRATRGPP